MLWDSGQGKPPPSLLASIPGNLALSSRNTRYSRNGLDLGGVDEADKGEEAHLEPAVVMSADGDRIPCALSASSAGKRGLGPSRRVCKAALRSVAAIEHSVFVAPSNRAPLRVPRRGAAVKVADVHDAGGGSGGGWSAMADKGAVGGGTSGGCADGGAGAQQEWLQRRLAHVGNTRWVVAQLLAMQTQLAANNSNKVVVTAVVDESNEAASVAVDETMGQRASGQVRMHGVAL